VLCGHILQVVSLVEHQATIWRQHRRLLPVVRRLPYRKIRRQQMMVHDHHIGFGRAAPRPEQEAAIEVRTLEPGAEIGFRADLVPDFGRGRHGEVAQGAVAGVCGPLDQAQQLIVLVRLEQRSLAAHCAIEP
jgi:hypothetical protein